jgi:hypothetical protein
MRRGTLIVINAAKALIHDNRYTVILSVLCGNMNTSLRLTDDPEEGRKKGDDRVTICLLHPLEMSSESGLHR